MSFTEWLDTTYKMPLEDFWESSDELQIKIEKEYQTYLKEKTDE